MLDDWRTAATPPRVHAALAFLEKLTLRPDDVGRDEISALRQAGLTDDEIRDASYVCYLFSVYDRLADTLGWRTADQAGYDADADQLIKRGYLL